MLHGVLRKWVDGSKRVDGQAFGFVEPKDGGASIFAPARTFRGARDNIVEGQEVLYELKEDDRKGTPMASNWKLVQNRGSSSSSSKSSSSSGSRSASLQRPTQTSKPPPTTSGPGSHQQKKDRSRSRKKGKRKQSRHRSRSHKKDHGKARSVSLQRPKVPSNPPTKWIIEVDKPAGSVPPDQSRQRSSSHQKSNRQQSEHRSRSHQQSHDRDRSTSLPRPDRDRSTSLPRPGPAINLHEETFQVTICDIPTDMTAIELEYLAGDCGAPVASAKTYRHGDRTHGLVEFYTKEDADNCVLLSDSKGENGNEMRLQCVHGVLGERRPIPRTNKSPRASERHAHDPKHRSRGEKMEKAGRRTLRTSREDQDRDRRRERSLKRGNIRESRRSIPRQKRPGVSTYIRPGDWECPQCHQNIFASKSVCPYCGLDKHKKERKKSGAHNGKGGKPGRFIKKKFIGKKYNIARVRPRKHILKS